VEVVGEPQETPVEDRTASTEVIDVDERTAGSTLADALDEVTGVRVRRFGGLESYATVSIRGSESSQVLVLRDGVPLGSASAADVNLSELALSDFERIEIYRGPSAAHFGTGGLGGVVNLISRAPEEGRSARFELGLGSFMPGSWAPGRFFSLSAKRYVSGEATATVGPLRILAATSLSQTLGDFVFLDDNGTNWDETDDYFAIRENNDASQADLTLRASADLAPGLLLTVGESVSARSAGVAGIGAQLAAAARLRTMQSLTTVDLERIAPTSAVPRLRVRLGYRVRRDEWLDGQGEIGVGREHDDDLVSDLTGQVRLGWPLGATSGTAWLQGEVRGEEYLARNHLGAADDEWGWWRVTGALSGWMTWPLAGGAVELSPQARVELTDDGPVGQGPPSPEGAEEGTRGLRALTSEQLGVRVAALPWLSFRGSSGITQRQPSFLELFGDRGTVIGNPSLRDETGWTIDGGARVEARDVGPVAHGRIEVTGFYRLVDDLIQLEPNSQVTFVANNVGSASVVGVETTGLLRLDWASATSSRWAGFVTLRGGLTWMDAVDHSDRAYREGNRLPLRPSLETFGRLAVSWGPLEVGYEIEYVSGNYLDPANQYLVPERLIHSAEASADLRRWQGPTITLLARNLTDHITEEVEVLGWGLRRRPVVDVFGFPLPGLTVFLTVRWDLPRGLA